MAWLYLFIAGGLEVFWSTFLKLSEGFTKLWPSVWAVAGMIASFFFLSQATKTLPMGTAYGIWMLYSSGLELTFIACILYAPGILVYALGKKERGRPVFERPYEMVLAIALAVLALIAIFMIATGRIRPF